MAIDILPKIIDTQGIGLYHFYRAMDFLDDHKEKIEEALYCRL